MPGKVLAYLGRYTHKTAIANHRLVDFDGEHVRFRWRDYADGNKVKVMRLDVDEFIRRFLLHVLPRGFTRLRHYGLLANRCRARKLARCRALLAQPDPEPREPETTRGDAAAPDRDRHHRVRPVRQGSVAADRHSGAAAPSGDDGDEDRTAMTMRGCQSRSGRSVTIDAPQSSLRLDCAVHRRTVQDSRCSDATTIAAPDLAAAVPLSGSLGCVFLV